MSSQKVATGAEGVDMEIPNQRIELMKKCLKAANNIYMDILGVGEYDRTQDMAIAQIATTLFNDARESERKAGK